MITNIPVRNKMSQTLRIMIEPAAQSYDIPAKNEIIVSGDFDYKNRSIEIDIWDENFLSLWVTSKVSVTLNGLELEPLKDL